MNGVRCAVINKDNSMGLVRYYLAFVVLVAHFNVVFGTDWFLPTSSYNAVGGFFALSGFLVYGSYLRKKNLKLYFTHRARRILPSYLFIVLLSAFGLCCLSTLPAREYFLNAQWVKYLLANATFLNFLEPELPGVFTENAVPAVNGSLWTMKVEVTLYLSVPVVVALISWLRQRYRHVTTTAVLVTIYVASVIYRIMFHELYVARGSEIYNILSRQVFGQLMYFYTEVFIYLNYDRLLRWRWLMVGAACVLAVVGDAIPYYQFWLSPIVVSVLVIYISLLKGAQIFNRNNVSYDIYLMHFPVMQTVAALSVGSVLPDWALAVICLLLILLLAEFSWHAIGKHILYPKNR
jgi:peptidoglycan/LPS O-acetylase OafA/YrhL